jgi:hypothetical protein
MAPSLVERQKIAKDTIARSASIAAETPGASLESSFISEQLPTLRDLQCPGITDTDLNIVNLDSFSAARNILENHTDAQGKVAVLNLASDEERAGGWIYSLSTTQVCASTSQLLIDFVIVYGFIGRSLMLLRVSPVQNSQTILLSLAKFGSWISSGYFLPFGCHIQRRSGQ